MKINTEHVDSHPTLEVVTSLQAEGYSVSIEETRVCPASSLDEVHYLQLIETTTEPYPADLVTSETTTWVCSCPDFLFRQSPPRGVNTVGDMGHCKHIKAEIETGESRIDKMDNHELVCHYCNATIGPHPMFRDGEPMCSTCRDRIDE
jgi:hypothetical protein